MLRCICFDWGGTLMSEDGPQDRACRPLWCNAGSAQAAPTPPVDQVHSLPALLPYFGVSA